MRCARSTKSAFKLAPVYAFHESYLENVNLLKSEGALANRGS